MIDNWRSLHARCVAIQLLVLDVDGVLTDGSIIYADSGSELKVFHVRDGVGIKAWRQQGKPVAILSSRSSRVVEARAAELGIETVIQGAADKLAAFRQVLARDGLEPSGACFIGDDLPDLPVLVRCGLAVAVGDACPEAKALAHYVTTAAGGRGAVRETIELILRCQGRWQGVVEGYRN
jgi:3-deoxy-D-manno-octulosonate 8-phosphate phosphatase (KDO 8-P phosphatase)